MSLKPHTPGFNETVVKIEKQRWLVPVSLFGSIAIGLTGTIVTRAEASDTVRPAEVHSTSLVPSTRTESFAVAWNPKVVSAPHPSLAPRPASLPVKHATAPKAKPKIEPKPIAQQPPIPRKLVVYSALRRSLADQIEKVPSLPEAAKLFPNSGAFKNYKEQLAHIEYLRQHVHVTAEDYRNFKINKDYSHAFDGQKGYDQRISPTMLGEHWTVNRYPGGVQEFIDGMKSEGLRTMYFTRPNGQVYQLFDSVTRFPQHAKGANLVSQGNENEAKDMLDMTVAQAESDIMLSVHFTRDEIDRSPSSTTILGHYAIDLLFANPTYDGATGSFHTYYPKDANGNPLRDSKGNLVPPVQPYIDKSDLPQEYMALVIEKSQELAAELGG